MNQVGKRIGIGIGDRGKLGLGHLGHFVGRFAMRGLSQQLTAIKRHAASVGHLGHLGHFLHYTHAHTHAWKRFQTQWPKRPNRPTSRRSLAWFQISWVLLDEQPRAVPRESRFRETESVSE